VKESEVTQAACFIIELLPLGLLRHAHKDVAGLLLSANQRGSSEQCSPVWCARADVWSALYLQQVVQRVLAGLAEELLLYAGQRSLPQTLQTDQDAVGQTAVHQDTRRHQVKPP